jgi:radical SAM protein with 4Fe4S-binding SPASM domain
MLRDIELRLDITNNCNLRCIMCHLPYEHKPPRAMSLDEFKQATHGILHRVNALFLSWTTEPLLNKELPEIIAYARGFKVPCITLVTNLTMLTEKTVDAFVNNGLHRINVSIDAADPQLYAVIRQRDCFEKVVDNVRRLQELKKKRHSRFPIIALNTVLLKMNITRLKPIIDLCVSLKVNELNCSLISVPRRYDDRHAKFELKGLSPQFNLHDETIDVTNEAIKKILKTVIAYADARGVVVTIPNRSSLLSKNGIPKHFEMARYAMRKAANFPFRSIAHIGCSYVKSFFSARSSFCSYPWRQLVVTAEGDVLPCCVADETLALGKISETPLSDIWNGDALKNMRDHLSHGNPPEFCCHCVRGRSKNRHGF